MVFFQIEFLLPRGAMFRLFNTVFRSPLFLYLVNVFSSSHVKVNEGKVDDC